MQVLNRILDLIESTTPAKRSAVREIYLAQFGAELIPCCEAKYLQQPAADYRADLVRFVLRYARADDRALRLARSALQDRSRTVRHNGCALFAYSLKRSALEDLRPLLSHKDSATAGDAQRAIDAVTSGNQNRFYPAYSSWGVPPDDPDQPKRESVDQAIVAGAPELVAALREILGDLYQRWRP